MKKINFLWIILNSIFLILFNTLFFVIGGKEHNASVWISYGFIHFAYIMLLVTPLLVRKFKNVAIFGYPLLTISTTYFLIQLVVGVVFILLALSGYKTALLVQICLAGLYGILLTIYMLANEYTAIAEEKRQVEIAYVKEASVKVKSLLDYIKDKELKKKVEIVYDIISSSPIKTHEKLADVENVILQSIYELEKAVSDDDKEKIMSISDSLVKSMNERNSRLKNLN